MLKTKTNTTYLDPIVAKYAKFPISRLEDALLFRHALTIPQKALEETLFKRNPGWIENHNGITIIPEKDCKSCDHISFSLSEEVAERLGISTNATQEEALEAAINKRCIHIFDMANIEYMSNVAKMYDCNSYIGMDGSCCECRL